MEFIYKEDKLFACNEGAELGYVWFSKQDDEVKVIQTLVYENARGLGVAKALNEKFFSDLNNENKPLKVEILCSYSVNYFEKNKERFSNLTNV